MSDKTAEEIEDWLIEQIKQELGSDKKFDRQASFMDLGMGSVEVTALSGALEDWLDCDEIQPTLLFDYPNVEALAAYLEEFAGD